MSFLRLLMLLALAAAGTMVPAAARAQFSGGGNLPVSLEILWPPLTGVGTRPLVFGAVTPGTAKTVLPKTPEGGEWRITGIRNRSSIIIRFALPAAMTNGRGGSIPLDFNGNYAGNCELDRRTGLCDEVTYIAWNPVSQASFTDTPDRARPGRTRYDATDFLIYIGGRALPAANAPAGAYTATITVTVTVN